MACNLAKFDLAHNYAEQNQREYLRYKNELYPQLDTQHNLLKVLLK